MSKKYYTGIGSRSTPKEILKLMRKIAYKMAIEGYILRSGGAEGADTAFADGWGDAYSEDLNSDGISSRKAEIYLPWNGFNAQYSTQEGRMVLDYSKAANIVKDIHPTWERLNQAAQTLHSRNAHQVLGKDLQTPSKLVIFWAPEVNKSIKGGTATAVKLARKHNIPVFNLADDEVYNRLQNFVKEKE